MYKFSLEEVECFLKPVIHKIIISNGYLIHENDYINKLVVFILFNNGNLLNVNDVYYLKHPKFNEYYIKTDQELFDFVKSKNIQIEFYSSKINYIKKILDHETYKSYKPYKYHQYYDKINPSDRTPYPTYLLTPLYKSIKLVWDQIDNHDIKDDPIIPLKWIREFENFIKNQQNIENGKYAIKTLKLQTFSSEGLFEPIWLTISEYLRGKLSNLTPETINFFNTYIYNFKNLILNSPSTDQDFIVYHGTSGRGYNWNIGDVVEYPQILSSSLILNIPLKGYIDDDDTDEDTFNISGIPVNSESCCILAINIPKGSHLGWDRDELQVLFLPGSKFKITDVKLKNIDNNNSGSIKIIKANYLL